MPGNDPPLYSEPDSAAPPAPQASVSEQPTRSMQQGSLTAVDDLPEQTRTTESGVSIEAAASSIPTEPTAERASSGAAKPGVHGPTTAAVQSDQIRIDRYTVLYPLGKGGMGIVYAAYDPKLDRNVALKLLPTRRAQNERSKQRLIREARALAKLSHPHVVQVHDVGEYRESIYIAMELVDGQSAAEWCADRPRPSSWRDILAVYRQAAQGLAAAHDKGLIHRDFKPSNVLVGRDHRARVVDFGIAFVHDRDLDSNADPSSHPGSPDNIPPDEPRPDELADNDIHGVSPRPLWHRRISERITQVNAVLGTPSYMAPEQHETADVTAIADQYSLCASLYEGLYGEPPFRVPRGPNWLIRLRDLKRKGISAPPNTEVPVWLFRVLQRGLSPDPADRFPSMGDLIHALSSDPEALRRTRLRTAALAGSSSLAALGLAALVTVLPKEHSYALCMETAQELTGRWQAAKTSIHESFLATGHPNAAGTYERVTRFLTTYVDDWIAMQNDVCAAANAGPANGTAGIIASADVALRVDCLQTSKNRLIEQVDVFAQADTEVLSHAVWAVMRLPAIAGCGNVDQLRDAPRLPDSGNARARLDELFGRLDRVQVLFASGKYGEAQAEVEAVLRESPALTFPALDGWALYWAAKIHQELGFYDAARTAFQQALEHAAEAGHDDLIALCWMGQITMLSSRLGLHDEAMSLVAAAQIAVKRAKKPQLERDLADALGFLAMGRGHLVEASSHYQRALMLGESHFGLEHPDVVWAVHNLALVSQRQGKLHLATEDFKRSIELWEQSLGPDHPNLAHPLTNLGLVLHDQGAYEEARTVLMRAVAIREATFGPTHQELGYPLTNLGLVLNQLGKHKEAKTYLLRAVTNWEQAFGNDHPAIGHALNNLGWASVALGDTAAAKAYYQRAIDLWERVYGPAYPALVYALEGLRDTERAAGNEEAASALDRRAKALRAAK